MYLEHLRRVLGHLKRTLRKEQRLTVEQFSQLLQLSDAINDLPTFNAANFLAYSPHLVGLVNAFHGR